MKAVVTGGAGFIGSHLVDALVADGHSVLVCDNFSTGKESNLAGALRTELVHVAEGSILDAATRQAIVAFQPEAIFHLAGQINVRRSVDDPQFDACTNVQGTVAILEAAVLSGAQHVVFASTGGAIYGDQEAYPAAEDHRTLPECPYGVSKLCAEQYLAYFARAHSLGCVSLRYSNVYGPRQNPKGEAGVVAIFCERIAEQKSLRINGDGEQTRDFVYVGDVVAANLGALAISTRGTFEIFNVGSGIETSVNLIAEHVTQIVTELHPDRALVFENGPALAGEQRRSVIDATKLQQRCGWHPATSLLEGLRTTLTAEL